MRRGDKIAIAILAALVTLLFLDVILGANSLYVRDLALYYYPAKHVLRDIVLGGDFPSWNPFFSAGQPLAANPEHEVFYPLTWLILLPSFHLGFHWLIVLHLYIAAVAMYAFLRSLDLEPPASFFGALSFVFGGVCLSYLNLLPYLFIVAWLPLTCLFTRRFVLHGRKRDFALATFFLGLQLLIGEPSTILQTGLLLGIYALARRSIPRVAIIILAALLLASVQLIPAVDHAAQSVRARGFNYESVTSWSMPPARLGELLQPNLLGHQLLNEKRVYWGSILYPGRGFPFLHTIYPGLLITALMIAGLFARVRGWRLTLVLLATSVVLALGAHTPLWRWLYDAGLLRSFRYPEKFILLGLFAANVFASVVLDRLLADDARVQRIALSVLIALTILTAVIALTSLHARFFVALWQPPARVLEDMLPLWRSGWLIAAAKALLLLVLLRNVPKLRRPIALALLGVFVFLDLGMLLPELAPRVPSSYYTEAPMLSRAFPQNRREWRFFHVASWQIPSAGGYIAPQRDLYWVHRNAMYPPMPATWGIRTAIEIDYDRTALLPTADFTDAVWQLSRLRADWLNAVSSMANVWYAGIFVPADEAYRQANENRRILQPVRLIELEHHPRYFFAEHIETIRGKDDFVKKFALHTAFIREPSFVPASGVVRNVRETANTARIDVESAGRAFLVMSVTPQKYWHVSIDGKETRAIVTNLGFQGVIIPNAGRHVVEMRYRNPWFLPGSVLSLLTLIGLLFASRRA